MKKLILLILIFSNASLAAGTGVKPDPLKRNNDLVENRKLEIPANAVPASSELQVGVKGMVCAFCAQGIEKKFKSQKEVEKIQVSLENKFVKIKFREGQRLSNEKISEILKDAGYESDFGGQ